MTHFGIFLPARRATGDGRGCEAPVPSFFLLAPAGACALPRDARVANLRSEAAGLPQTYGARGMRVGCAPPGVEGVRRRVTRPA